MGFDLGSFGVWQRADQVSVGLAAAVERLGYRAVWLGGSPAGDLADVEELLAGTSRLVVATGIVNIWKDDAASVADAYHRVAGRYPGRFLLGVGVGHREAVGDEYARPYAALVRYLDELDAAGVPVEARALAALGPKVLELAGRRSAGAHPYLTTPAHTRQAREILGDWPLLAPEHKVVLETDPERARALGRPAARTYLRLANYANNLRRLGFTAADLAGEGSDRVIDALVLHGDAATVARGLRAHLDAGADHVTVQAIGDGDVLPAYRELAEVLLAR